MQRIAFISDHASPLALLGGTDSGGQNVYVAHLSRELARLGYLVDIYTRRDHPLQPAVVEWKTGVRVIHVNAGPAVTLPKERLLPHMDAFAQAMLQIMRSHGWTYDLVHAHFFMSGMVAHRLKREAGLPFVITFHALGRVRRQCQGSADGFPDERFAIEETLMREADGVIAECEQDRDDMLALYEARPARLAIVPCGFDPDELWPVRETARASLGLPAQGFILLQLGRMVPRKGVDNVIRALHCLRNDEGVAAQLLVVGGDTHASGALGSLGLAGPLGQLGQPGPAGAPGSNGMTSRPAVAPPQDAELRRLSALAAELGIAPHVSFTGAQPREKLREYYSAANVFVTTPWYEPFGITPLEAMACATPVIGSAVGGIRTTVIDGKTGFLVPPNDPARLASRLALLAREPQLAERLGWTGLRRAHRHFTWRRVAMQMVSVYRSILRDRAGLGATGMAGLHLMPGPTRRPSGAAGPVH